MTINGQGFDPTINSYGFAIYCSFVPADLDIPAGVVLDSQTVACTIPIVNVPANVPIGLSYNKVDWIYVPIEYLHIPHDVDTVDYSSFKLVPRHFADQNNWLLTSCLIFLSWFPL